MCSFSKGCTPTCLSVMSTCLCVMWRSCRRRRCLPIIWTAITVCCLFCASASIEECAFSDCDLEVVSLVWLHVAHAPGPWRKLFQSLLLQHSSHCCCSIRMMHGWRVKLTVSLVEDDACTCTRPVSFRSHVLSKPALARFTGAVSIGQCKPSCLW